MVLNNGLSPTDGPFPSHVCSRAQMKFLSPVALHRVARFWAVRLYQDLCQLQSQSCPLHIYGHKCAANSATLQVISFMLKCDESRWSMRRAKITVFVFYFLFFVCLTVLLYISISFSPFFFYFLVLNLCHLFLNLI
jgi:hypothetical protein